MRYATILLGQSFLSVQVRTELLRITGAFINASVQHEARNQRRKLRRTNRSFDDEEDDGSFAIDYRKLDIYCSLNNKVHGAAVYSSPANAVEAASEIPRARAGMIRIVCSFARDMCP